MSSYVNGGAFDYDGMDFRSKKAFREAVAADPSRVELYDTSYVGARDPIVAANLPEDLVWHVTGPNPYTSRKWYANVSRNAKGQVKVS